MPHHDILQLEPDEQLIRVVKRTKLGLVPIVFVGIATFVGLLFAIFALGRWRDAIAESFPLPAAIAIIAGVAFLIGLVLFIYLVVYLGNKLLITNQRIVTVVQKGLFRRQVSQMSLADVQEVTVRQHNLLESLFDFGIVHIETAGEMDNFSFKLAAHPHSAAKSVNEANESFEAKHPQPLSRP